MLAVVAFSCSKNDDGTQGAINLKVGSCFDKFQTETQICLDSVVNDSRCPTGFECVWEGDAIAAFTLTKNKKVTRFNLHTNNRFQNDTIVDGVSVKLIDISPYPIADKQIDPNDYVAEISVDEN